jgi:multiple sugar transport system substrate-binding protein
MSRNKLGSNLLAILLAAVATLAFSCTGKESEMTFMVGGAPDELEYWEEIIAEFEQSSGLNVRIVRQPTDSDQRRQGLIVPLKSRQRDPDLFLMDVVWIGQFVASGWLEPLDSYLITSDFSIEPFFQGVIDFADRYGDTLFALPVYVDGGLLYCRKDLLEEYGYDHPPATWAELTACSDSIQKRERQNNPGFYGFVWQGAQYEGLVCTFLEFVASNNGGILDGQRMRFDTPENLVALQFMHDLIHKHEISPPNTFTEMREEEVRSFFQRGNALFERNWPYAWKLHESEGSAVRGKVAITALPRFDGGRSVSTLGGWHLGISRYSDSKREAWELAKFIASFSTQKKLVLHLGWNPGREDVYQDEEVKQAYPHLHLLAGIFQNAISRPNLPYYSQLSEVIQRHANACLSGGIEPEEALEKMQSEVEKLGRMYDQK